MSDAEARVSVPMLPMQCPKCRHDSSEGAYFCTECGAVLGESMPRPTERAPSRLVSFGRLQEHQAHQKRQKRHFWTFALIALGAVEALVFLAALHHDGTRRRARPVFPRTAVLPATPAAVPFDLLPLLVPALPTTVNSEASTPTPPRTEVLTVAPSRTDAAPPTPPPADTQTSAPQKTEPSSSSPPRVNPAPARPSRSEPSAAAPPRAPAAESSPSRVAALSAPDKQPTSSRTPAPATPREAPAPSPRPSVAPSPSPALDATAAVRETPSGRPSIRGPYDTVVVGDLVIDFERRTRPQTNGQVVDYTVRLARRTGLPVSDADVALRGETSDGKKIEAPLDPSGGPGVFVSAGNAPSSGIRRLMLRIARPDKVLEIPVSLETRRPGGGS